MTRQLINPTNPIDPRLRARRVAVSEARVRRRHRLLVFVVGLVTIATGAWLLAYRSPLLDVDHVDVRGEGHAEARSLARATGVATGTPLLGVDRAAVRHRVEAQPWVLQATVTRRWPGTLQVTVVERTPVALLGQGGAATVVDQTGRVLGPAPRSAVLPHLEVPVVPVGSRLDPRSRTVAAVIGDLPERVRREVLRGGVAKGNLTFTLIDGVTVRWGDPTATRDKARSLQLLLAKADRASIATIDVSVPSAAALTRKDGPVA